MSLKDRIAKVQSTSAVAGESIDQGLRSYMLKVYNFMASGILLTGFIALGLFKFSVITDQSGNITGLTSLGSAIYTSALMWVIALAPLGIVFYMSFGINKMSAAKAQTVFWIFENHTTRIAVKFCIDPLY